MRRRVKRSSWARYGVAVCAVLAGLGVTEAIVKISHTQTMVVTTHYLAPFTKIGPNDVKTVSVPSDSGIQGLTSNVQNVVGKYLTFPVPSGYPVTSGTLSTSNSYSSFLTEWELKNHQQGVMLELKINSDIEKVVNPNETIDLLIPDPTGKTPPQQVQVPVLTVLSNGSPVGLMIFVPDSEYSIVAPAILSGNVQVGLISQVGSYATASAVTALPTVSGNAQSSSTQTNDSTTTTTATTSGEGTGNTNTSSQTQGTSEQGTVYKDPKTGQTVIVGATTVQTSGTNTSSSGGKH